MNADAAKRAERAVRRRQLDFKFLDTADSYARELVDLIECSTDKRPNGEQGQRSASWLTTCGDRARRTASWFSANVPLK